MDEVLMVLFCWWYIFMGFGIGKLIQTNKVGVDKNCPIIVVLLIWWMLIPICAVLRLKDNAAT